MIRKHDPKTLSENTSPIEMSRHLVPARHTPPRLTYRTAPPTLADTSQLQYGTPGLQMYRMYCPVPRLCTICPHNLWLPACIWGGNACKSAAERKTSVSHFFGSKPSKTEILFFPFSPTWRRPLVNCPKNEKLQSRIGTLPLSTRTLAACWGQEMVIGTHVLPWGNMDPLETSRFDDSSFECAVRVYFQKLSRGGGWYQPAKPTITLVALRRAVRTECPVLLEVQYASELFCNVQYSTVQYPPPPSPKNRRLGRSEVSESFATRDRGFTLCKPDEGNGLSFWC